METIIAYYYIDNDFYKAQDINYDLNWLIINHFYKPIDDDKNWVIAVSVLIYQNW